MVLSRILITKVITIGNQQKPAFSVRDNGCPVVHSASAITYATKTKESCPNTGIGNSVVSADGTDCVW